MIKNLIFDWGGVCTEKHFYASVADVMPIEKGETIRYLIQHGEDYELGKISPKDFWTNYKNHFKLHQTPEKLIELFHAASKPVKEVLEIIKHLKKDYQTILLTNNFEDMIEYIDNKHTLGKYFHHVFSSNNLGIRKPDLQIFELVASRLKIHSNETVFIDDQEKNIYAAKRLDFFTILYENPKQLKRELTFLGVKQF